MIWVLLEVGLAFGIAIAIVWWTFPRKKRPQDIAAAQEAAEETVGKTVEDTARKE